MLRIQVFNSEDSDLLEKFELRSHFSEIKKRFRLSRKISDPTFKKTKTPEITHRIMLTMGSRKKAPTLLARPMREGGGDKGRDTKENSKN